LDRTGTGGTPVDDSGDPGLPVDALGNEHGGFVDKDVGGLEVTVTKAEVSRWPTRRGYDAQPAQRLVGRGRAGRVEVRPRPLVRPRGEKPSGRSPRVRHGRVATLWVSV